MTFQATGFSTAGQSAASSLVKVETGWNRAKEGGKIEAQGEKNAQADRLRQDGSQ